MRGFGVLHARLLRHSWAILLVLPLASQTLPVRLKTAISTETAKPGDSFDAVVIAGAYQGSLVRGTVENASRAALRATLLLHFTQLDSLPIDGRVTEVDNARESVDEEGCIQGILASETISGRLDTEIDRVGEKYSGVADILSAVKGAVLNRGSIEIAFGAGVEMTVRLAVALPPRTAPHPKPLTDRRLTALVDREPFQTLAQHPAKPSDITNLLLIGTEDSLRRAFAQAGWALAASLTPRTKSETLLALAEDRGYAEAPVSVLTLDGKDPDLVFEKTADTFARRHHLRVWRRPAKFHGSAVWAVAATHDTGISFSDVDRTFIHRIDPQVDRERQKVADDLNFAGYVQSETLLPRPQIPQRLQNATGDPIETDSKIQVLLLR